MASKVAATEKLHAGSSFESRARRAAFNISAGGKVNLLGENELVDAVAELDPLDRAAVAFERQAGVVAARVRAVGSVTATGDGVFFTETIDGLASEAGGTPAAQDLGDLQAIAERELQYTEERRNLALLSMAGAWGVSLVDALFYSPGFDVSRSSEGSRSSS